MQCPQLLGPARVEGGPDCVGAPQAGSQSCQPAGVEGVDRLAHGLVVAAQLASNRDGPLPARTGQQDLAAAQNKGLGGAQASLHLLALRVR